MWTGARERGYRRKDRPPPVSARGPAGHRESRSPGTPCCTSPTHLTTTGKWGRESFHRSFYPHYETTPDPLFRFGATVRCYTGLGEVGPPCLVRARLPRDARRPHFRELVV